MDARFGFVSGRPVIAFSQKRAAVALLVVASLAVAQQPVATVRNNFADPNVRARVVAELRAKSQAAKAEAIAFARTHNLPVRGETARGTYELMAVDDGVPVYYTTTDLNGAITTGANLLHDVPNDLSGAGLTVGIWDSGGPRTTHQELRNRVAILDGAATQWHATAVAGVVGAAGMDPYALGMAPRVLMDAYEWNADRAEMASRGASYPGEPGKIYVSNHSYGRVGGWAWGTWSGGEGWHLPGDDVHSVFGKYDSDANAWDQICYDAPYFLPIKSAGNDRNENPAAGEPYYAYFLGWHGPYPYDPATDPPGDGVYKNGYDTIPTYTVAKNILTVGAVTAAVSGGMRNPSAATMSAFSSWGPADDGRIKPDVVADGVDVYGAYSADNESYRTGSGTSYSGPNAAGSAILLVELYARLFPGQGMRASTLKGVILHTTDDLGNAGPDYVNGWGLMNAEAAADQIRKHHDYPRQNRIVEGQLTPADPVHLYSLESAGVEPIRATLCWTDPPGVPTSGHDDPTPKLVNDLDLRVYGPGGSPTYYPFVLDRTNPSAPATTGDNHVDNVEQVYVPIVPAAGSYTVEVSYKGTLTDAEQYYSLVTSGQGAGSAGSMVIERDVYRCADTIRFEVIDADLRGFGAQSVTATSSAGDSETVLLTETPSGSAVFVGEIAISSGAVAVADGTLQVSHGGTITGSYYDADDGSGAGTAVVDGATVDCVAPAIAGVTTAYVTAAGATVTFQTDEVARAEVDYGTSCGAMMDLQASYVVGISHELVLHDLLPATNYFYVVTARDIAGNVATNDNGGACYTVGTLAWRDYFSEHFSSVDCDLDHQTMTLAPDGSEAFYRACRGSATAFPTDPSGGTVLPLTNDSYVAVTLSGGAQVLLYGVGYSSLYVGDNGYITFTQGDTDYSESLPDHFRMPRISGLFVDLNASAGGTISWKQLEDRVAVTYENVPEWSVHGGIGSNSFQIEMFFDGTIRMTWLGIDAGDGLGGLSAGGGKPAAFLESDLTGYELCEQSTIPAVSSWGLAALTLLLLAAGTIVIRRSKRERPSAT